MGPILRNVHYDKVLELEVTENAICVGFAYNLALVVGADDEVTQYVYILGTYKYVDERP